MSATARDLPDTLASPLRSGEEWWYWLGGRPALDLVNTLRERWRRRVETLASPADLGLWLVRAELVPERPRVTRALLDEARDLREAIDLCVQAVVAHATVPSDAVAHIDSWLLDAAARPRLAIGGDGRPRLDERPPGDSARAALAAIALDAARMLGTEDEARRVRICASDTCSARFYDRSPAAARRWCSMALCGNEAKARRHRERAKGRRAGERDRAAERERATRQAAA
jgi:predicted RNA-binding Zn ribbon-like protein